jgi:dTDP-glucose 4,6-dehydratase
MTEAYTPKNILITGGAGFIASHVVIHFVEKYPQYKIVNLDKLDYCSSLKNLSSIEDRPNYKFIKGNILSTDLISYILKSEEIDTIIHFAAQTHVDNSFGNSMSFTKNNILGTHVLLEAARFHKVKRFVHVSTDEVYGESTTEVGFTEADGRIDPSNPYSATKAGAEFLVNSYRSSFKVPVIITRGNNVYGPHQFPEKIVPKFINLLERGKPLPIHGDGTNRRKYVYATDVAKAFDVICHNGVIGEVYNIGTDVEFTNLQLAEYLLRHYKLEDQREKYLKFVEDRPFNDCRYHIDSSKLNRLGWQPTVKFEDGIAETVSWYRKNLHSWQNVEEALVAHPRIGLVGDRADAEDAGLSSP